MKTLKTYIFNWTNDGYNTVQASSKKEAIRKANELGKPYEYAPGKMTCGLVCAEDTIHVADDDEVRAWDRRYASMCD